MAYQTSDFFRIENGRSFEVPRATQRGVCIIVPGVGRRWWGAFEWGEYPGFSLGSLVRVRCRNSLPAHHESAPKQTSRNPTECRCTNRRISIQDLR